MSAIQILPPEVAEQIAAGEVVERPASVVKELIENALDAGGTAISVEVASGGLALVRVSDNGCGMRRDDACLAPQRFSTSKVHTLADLTAIHTLGFRGEALAAIGAVARLTILTRTSGEVEGTRVNAVGGQVTAEPAASPVGCSVAVADLFYNTPARRKFLKSPLREAELCQDTVIRYALGFPEVAFRWTVDGHERFAAPPAALAERLVLAMGRESARQMLPIAWQAGDLRVWGLISSPAIGRSQRDRQHFFLNRRPIRSGLLAVMLERPYAGRLTPGRYPLAAVHIELDPGLVDVNVHPRKAEVRVAQEQTVYHAVSQAVQQTLEPFPVRESFGVAGWPFPETPTAQAMVAEPGSPYEIAGRAEALGQVRRSYLVARTFEGLLIVDQHAAHEAILIEQLRASKRPEPVLPPLRLELTPAETELLAAHLAVLSDLGLEVEPFGRSGVVVRAIPGPLVGQDLPALVRDVLEELAIHRALGPEALREKVAAKAACRVAIKAGDPLTAAQQQRLIDELLSAWSPSVCPHGRPTLFPLSVEEMERRFSRR